MPQATTATFHVCALVLLFPGGMICLWNFYLAFLRYPLFRFTGGQRADYRWDSGLPLIGSAIVAVAALCSLGDPWLLWPAIGLIVIDTGGLHWAIGVITYHWLKDRFAPEPAPTTGDDPPSN